MLILAFKSLAFSIFLAIKSEIKSPSSWKFALVLAFNSERTWPLKAWTIDHLKHFLRRRLSLAIKTVSWFRGSSFLREGGNTILIPFYNRCNNAQLEGSFFSLDLRAEAVWEVGPICHSTKDATFLKKRRNLKGIGKKHEENLGHNYGTGTW